MPVMSSWKAGGTKNYGCGEELPPTQAYQEGSHGKGDCGAMASDPRLRASDDVPGKDSCSLFVATGETALSPPVRSCHWR